MAFDEAQMPLVKTFGVFTVKPKIIKFEEVLNSVFISLEHSMCQNLIAIILSIISYIALETN